jgi:hypothetical protein
MVLSLIPLHKSNSSGKSSIQTLTIIRIIPNESLSVHHELEGSGAKVSDLIGWRSLCF